MEDGPSGAHPGQHLLRRLSLGLSAILDEAKPGDAILMCSFGSGAGSDGFIFTATKNLPKVQGKAKKTRDYLDTNPFYLDYGTYVKFGRKIRKNVGGLRPCATSPSSESA